MGYPDIAITNFGRVKKDRSKHRRTKIFYDKLSVHGAPITPAVHFSAAVCFPAAILVSSASKPAVSTNAASGMLLSVRGQLVRRIIIMFAMMNIVLDDGDEAGPVTEAFYTASNEASNTAASC